MEIAVVHNLPAGGQKRALDEQVKRLSKLHKVDLFTPSDFGYQYPLHFPQSVISIYFSLPKVYRQIAEKINRGKYDVVYVNPCFLTQAPFVLRFLKMPSVYYCPEPKREFYEYIPRKSNFWTYYATLPFRYPIKYIDYENTIHAAKIVTNSVYSKGLIKRIYGKIAYVNYPGVDTELFRPYLNSVSLSPSILTVGDISLHKGHDFIIRSLSLIQKNIRPDLIIVGHGGSEKGYIKRLAASLGVNIKLYEDVTDKELVDIYNKVRVFVYASHNEPFGMVLLEALACGLPVVAVDEGGIKEIVRDSSLGILTKRNLEDFKKAMTRYLKKGQTLKDSRSDPERTERIKRREYVLKNWGWEKSVKELEEYLN